MELEAGRRRAKLDVQRDLALAWHVEYFRRQQKLPALAVVLRERTGRRQTVTEQKSMLEMMSQNYGIPLKTRKKKR